MKKLILIIMAIALVASLGIGMTVAGGSNGIPASKASAKVSEIYILESTGTDSTEWTTILTQNIKSPKWKDLFIDVSLMCGLYTQTLVKSKGGTKDRSWADAHIEVRVLVDGEPASPGNVTFSRRMQDMEAAFGGILYEECISVDCVCDPDCVCTVTIDEDCVGNETLELILDTMDAHSFNFVAADLETSQNHIVQVQAWIQTSEDWQEGSALAMATIGKGSVTIEQVRMVKDEDWVILE
jgi:hypothetical protein